MILHPMILHPQSLLIVTGIFLFSSTALTAQGAANESRTTSSPPPVMVLAHYMPWYAAKPTSEVWGWHWTMNHFDPDKQTDGKRQIASHLYPLIGPYDSGDPHVLEYHLLLMKLAGIDGVIVDWYGLQDVRDYPILHRNTQRLIELADRLSMKFVICYEDQTIPVLVNEAKIQPAERVGHAVEEIGWLNEHWFGLDGYVRINNRPVLLSFGQDGLTNDEWSQCIERLSFPVEYFSEHNRRDKAVGAFDWPVPSEGIAACQRFKNDSREWSESIPVAFPRFKDIYEQANLHQSWGNIDDQNGNTFRSTLSQALGHRSKLIQVATWNDWGEGTSIEPSAEYRYRDLELMQAMRRKHIEPEFRSTPRDLELPLRLLNLRRALPEQDAQAKLNEVASCISKGKLNNARAILDSIDPIAAPETQSTTDKIDKTPGIEPAMFR